jgi:uncharacterized protein (UPF0335 family)
MSLNEMNPVAYSSGGGQGGNMLEARVAKLEAVVEHIQQDVSEIKQDVREMRKSAESDVSILKSDVMEIKATLPHRATTAALHDIYMPVLLNG